MGIVVGISLIFCIQAAIHVISYQLPADGRHIWFSNMPGRRTVFSQITTYCLTPKTWVYKLEFRCSHVNELRYTLFFIYFQLMTAIFDFQITQTSDSFPISFSVLLDPENLGIAIRRVFLSCLQGEIWILPPWRLPSWNSHFRWDRAMFYWMAELQKHRYKFWNCVPIMSAGWDVGTSGLEAAILDLPLPVWLESIPVSLIG